MNSTEKQAVLHCLKSMIDEEVCEECPLYGTTGTDHCEKDCVRLAINALEQEPCEDCVSRSAVLAIAGDSCLDLNSYEDTREFIDEINDLPSVTPQPKMGRWIPCSERLPNFAGVYLVTRYFPNNVMNPTYLVDACFFDGTDTWHNDNRINHDRKYLTNVVAWLEEPEPYKEIPTEAEVSEKE